ncbi:integrase [Nanoarchaeota archaeon]
MIESLTQGVFISKADVNIKNNFEEFVVYISKKNYSQRHFTKLKSCVKKLSYYTHFFSYKELLKIRDKLYSDQYYKALRALCNFFEEKYLENPAVLVDLERIRKNFKRPKATPDIYTPSDEQLVETLAKLKALNKKYYEFYVALMFSGVRIKEMAYYINSDKDFKTIENGNYHKVLLNYKRHCKNVFFLYFPKGFELSEGVIVENLSRFLTRHPEIIRPKYIRNWFYSKCLDLGVPSAIADFFQGRTPISVGDRHYLDRERMADKCYSEKLNPYLEEKFIKMNR